METQRPIIDYDREPAVPKGLRIAMHRELGGLGKLVWDPSRVRLIKLDPSAKSQEEYLEEYKAKHRVSKIDTATSVFTPGAWKSGNALLDNALRRAYEDGGIPLNANALDFFLDRQEVIPEEWTDRNIYFIGTEYTGRDEGSRKRIVRTLYPDGMRKLRREVNATGKLRWKLAWYILFPINRISFGGGKTEFVEGISLDFNDSLRYLTNMYVPVYNAKNLSKGKSQVSGTNRK